MIDLIHVERHHDIGITTWISWTWTHEQEYEKEHEGLNDIDKCLREAYVWDYLRKWNMVIICTWQGHGGMLVLGVWFTKVYSCSSIKFDCKNDKTQC